PSNVLDELGISRNERYLTHELYGGRVYSPNGSMLIVKKTPLGYDDGYVVERDCFDRALAAKAIRAGARVLVKTHATDLIIENGKVLGIRGVSFGKKLEIRAKIIIASECFESKIGRLAGIDTSLKPDEVSTCFEYTLANVSVEEHMGCVHFGNFTKGGYLWIFPKGDGVANVGISMMLSKLTKPGEPKSALDNFISSHDCLKKGQPIKAIAGAYSSCAPIERTVAEGIMLVGDAARQVDPLTGAGIANGCKAGLIAGKVAGKAVRDNDFSYERLNEYDKAWRDLLEERLCQSFVAKKIFSQISDDLLNRSLEVLKDCDLSGLNPMEILQLIRGKDQTIESEFERLLF
ncbi:MAG: NAD(P)/FAD-dependent oxidoreductase, partial [Thermoplasmata archaeon]